MQPEYTNKFKTKHFSFTPNSHCTYQEVKAYNNTLNHNYCKKDCRYLSMTEHLQLYDNKVLFTNAYY